MPALSSLTRVDPVRIVVPFGDEQVTVDFDRNGFTENWIRRREVGLKAGDVSSTSRAFAEILIGWDIAEDDGTPVAVTADTLAQLPFPFMRALDEAISEAALPSSEEGNGSKNISSSDSTVSGPTQVIPPNGPEPSPSPIASESLSPT